jgi:WD40 repeat protein
VNSAVFSPDGLRIITASRDATARIWDTASGAELAVLRGHPGAVLSAAFNLNTAVENLRVGSNRASSRV